MLYEVITHNPHGESLLTGGSLLRSSYRGQFFCQYCHQHSLPLEGRHLGTGGIAHFKRDASRITSYNVCYTKLLRQMALKKSIVPFPRAEWFKRGDLFGSRDQEVHLNMGCAGCHMDTNTAKVDP